MTFTPPHQQVFNEFSISQIFLTLNHCHPCPNNDFCCCPLPNSHPNPILSIVVLILFFLPINIFVTLSSPLSLSFPRVLFFFLTLIFLHDNFLSLSLLSCPHAYIFVPLFLAVIVLYNPCPYLS